MEIPVIYSDGRLIVCLKPAGVLSESPGMPELLEKMAGGTVYPVHRLDRAVGGLMVYAKDKGSAAALSALVSGGGLQKYYLAVVSGAPDEEKGTYRDLLFKDSRTNKSFVVKRMRKGVKEAELNYEVLEKKEGLTLLRVKLLTGRSHQIRLQFASRHMPLAGDAKYGSRIKSSQIALWSERLGFVHPFEKKAMEFSALPPKDFPWDRFEYIKEKRNGKDR